MADLTVKRGDTWPPVKGRAADDDGALDLASAASITFLMKKTALLVTGTVDVIDPPDAEGNNWSYTWTAGDTDVIGDYQVELEITWAVGHTETVPNSGYSTIT